MANQSYCRYENTSKDLSDCVDALWDSDCSEDLTLHEARGLYRLLERAKDIVSLEDKINNILDNQT